MSTTTSQNRRRANLSLFRSVNNWLHLWLGLISGIIVFIVSITGCIWVFQEEICLITEPFQFVEARNMDYALPSQILESAEQYIYKTAADSVNVMYAVSYDKPSLSAMVAYHHHQKGYTTLYLNPYTAEVLGNMYYRGSFFETIINGHVSLWLPHRIGSVLVNYGTLIFIILLITGLIWWYPTKWNRANVKKSFSVKWKAKWKRLNIDLHNVFGFYTFLIALILGITGIVMGIGWFKSGYYTVLSAGKDINAESPHPHSQSLGTPVAAAKAMDGLWLNIRGQYQGRGHLIMNLPAEPGDALSIDFRQKMRLNHDREERFFDQYTLAELKGEGPDHEHYKNLSAGEKLYRMNFDLHIGSIGGLPTKIIAFLASLVSASLPVTGFIIWYNRKFKKKGLRKVV